MGLFYYIFQAACGVIFVVEYSKFVTRSMNEDGQDEQVKEKSVDTNVSEPINEGSNPLAAATEDVMRAHAELDQTPDSVPGFVQDDVCSPFPWKSVVAFGIGVLVGAVGVWFYEKQKSSHKKDSETAVSSNLNENAADFSSVKNVTIFSEKKSNGVTKNNGVSLSNSNVSPEKKSNGVTKNNGVSLSNSNVSTEKKASDDYSSSEEMEKEVINQLNKNKVVELQPNDQTPDGIRTITKKENAEFPWGLVFLTIVGIAGLIYGGVCVYEKI